MTTMTPIERARELMGLIDKAGGDSVAAWELDRLLTTDSLSAICRALIAAEERAQELERALDMLLEAGRVIQNQAALDAARGVLPMTGRGDVMLTAEWQAAEAALAKGKELSDIRQDDPLIPQPRPIRRDDGQGQ